MELVKVGKKYDGRSSHTNGSQTLINLSCCIGVIQHMDLLKNK